MFPGENNLQFSNRLYCKIKIKYDMLTVSFDLDMVRKFCFKISAKIIILNIYLLKR